MSLADLVRERITTLGFTQAELARRAGVTPAFVSQLISGQRNPQRPEIVCALADALAVSSDDLYAAMHQAPPDLVAALTSLDHIRAVRATLNLPAPARTPSR